MVINTSYVMNSYYDCITYRGRGGCAVVAGEMKLRGLKME
jgi:hypothetical protein